MKKLIYSVFVLLLVFAACKPNRNNEETSAFETEFLWKGDSLGSSYYPKSALLIPVEPQRECTRKTYLQLQTGVHQSYIYDDFLIRRDENEEPESDMAFFSGQIGGMQIDSAELPIVVRNYHSEDSIIGCVGIDFFHKKMVLIDFENELVRFADHFNVPDSIKPLAYSVYLENKLLIPATMAGESVKFLCNPSSPLYVVFNYMDPGNIKIGNAEYAAPQTQMVENANPAFVGILGYAFFKDKVLIVDSENEQLFILNDFVK